MPNFTRLVIKMLLLLFAVFAVQNNYGQCSLYISNYGTNVAYPVQITVAGTAANTYTWQFGDTSADTVTGVPVVSHIYADTGIYTVCVYGFDSNTLCHDTTCQTIDLSCSVSGNLNYSSDSGLTVFTGNIQVVGAISTYYWLITGETGDTVYGQNSLSDTLALNLAPGVYTALLVATTNGGCYESLLLDSIIVGQPARCILLQQGVPQSQNTYIRSDIPNINFGLSPDFLAERWYYLTTGNVEARGLMLFDLSAIPAGSTITSASLSLYADSTTANSGNGYPGEPTYGQNDSSILQRITSPWNPLDVTWNTQPATLPANPVSLPQSTGTAQNYTVDITGFLQFWVQHPDSNFGMMLSMPAGLPYNNLVFCSSAHPDSALRPALNICYQAPLNACNANFTYTNIGDSVWFYNQSTGVDSVLWRFDNGDSSGLNDPVHAFTQNGIYLTTLTVVDSTGSCSSVTSVNVTGIVDDTLCGVVFFDVNRDDLYDNGDYPLTNFEVVIDGIAYYTDTSGFYRIPVGGGGHIISAVIQQIATYEQTSPSAPLNYTIATANDNYICGLDFGMFYGTQTGITSDTNNTCGQLSVFPNPFSNQAKIALSRLTGEPTQAVVYDVTGRTILSKEFGNDANMFIDRNQISSGIYLLEIKQRNSRIGVARIVIE